MTSQGCQDEFLQALQLLADVPDCYEVPHLVAEYCEALASADEPVVSGPLLELIAQTLGTMVGARERLRMVEEKFGEGSDEHFQALQELSDACLAAQKPVLAAPLLLKLSERHGRSDGRWFLNVFDVEAAPKLLWQHTGLDRC